MPDALQATLFDAEGNDRIVALTDIDRERIGESQVLWLDLDRTRSKDFSQLTDWLGVSSLGLPTEANSRARPRVDIFGSHLNVCVQTLGLENSPQPLYFLVGINWIVSVHDGPLEALEGFTEQVHEDSQLGKLSGASFLAAMLDWHLTEYYRAIERLDAQVDSWDDQAMSPLPKAPILPALRGLRQKIAALRRVLVPHREVFTALQRPDIASVFGLAEQDQIFASLTNQMERAIDSIDNSRDLVLGSFEMYSAQAAQKTNDTMRVLTVVTVLLLPIGTLAGVLGMNFQASFFDSKTKGFLIAVSAMALFVAVGWTVARRRDWI